MVANWRWLNLTDDVPFTPDVVIDGASVVNSQPCNLATCTARLTDDVLANDIEIAVDITENGVDWDRIFAGDVFDYMDTHIIATEPEWRFAARDYTARLDRTAITEGDRTVSESVEDRVLWIMGHTPSWDITTGGVEAISTTVDPHDYTGMTRREALDHVAGLVGALYYVDFDKDLVFRLATDVVAAPFDLEYPGSPPTSYPYSNFEYVAGVINQADAVYVFGDKVATVRVRAGAPIEDLRKHRVVVNSGIKTLTTAEQVGDQELERVGTATVRGSLRLYKPGLFPGMTVQLTNAEHAIDEAVIINTIHISPIVEQGQGVRAAFNVQYADRLACLPEVDLSRLDEGLADTGDDSDGAACGRAVTLLPSGMDSDLSLESGGGSQIFVHDPGAAKLAKYRLDLAIKVWEATASGGVPYICHQPGTWVPAIFGDRAYRRDNGNLEWSKQDEIAAVAAQVQDRRQFWVTGDSGEGSPIGFPFSGKDTFEADFGPTGAEEVTVVWRGYVTGTGSLKVDLSAGTMYLDPAVAAVAGYKFTHLYWVTSTAWTNASVPPDNTDMFDPAFDPAPPTGISTGTPANQVLVTAVGAAGGGGVASGWRSFSAVDTGDNVTAGLRIDSIGSGQWVMLMMKSTTNLDYVAAMHGLRAEFTIYGTATLDAPLSEPAGPVIQVRNSDNGALILSEDLAESGDSLRRSSSGGFVMLQQGTDDILRYSRSLVLEDTVTIADFFPCDDWNVDDAYNLYRLDGNVLTKYDPSGTELWERDLFADRGYRFPPSVSAGNGQQVIADEFVRVVGYIGEATWTDGSEAVLLTITKASGDVKVIQRFGGADGDAAQAQAVHRHADGCIFLAGSADGTEFEGKPLTTLRGWLMRVGDVATDYGGEGGIDTGHTHPAHSLDDHSDVDLTTTPPTTGDVLTFDGTDWVPDTSGGALDLDDLGDVDTTGVASGDVLTYNGTDWVPVAPGGSFDLDDLGDVDTTGVADGDALVYDAGNSEWVPGAAGGGDGWTQIDAVSDEDISSNTTLQDDNELVTPSLTSGKIYLFELLVKISNPVATGGNWKYAVGEDATNRGVHIATGLNTSGNAATTTLATNTTASSAMITTNGQIYAVWIRGHIVSNGGALKLVWAQNSSSGNVVRRYAGSWLRYRQAMP